MTLELTKGKKEKTHLVNSFLKKQKCKIRDFVLLIGSLIAVYPAITYGLLYCRNLKRAKTIALILNDYNYDDVI